MNVNEYGSTLYLSTGFNMASYTQLQVQFQRPDGTTFTRPAVLGTTTFTDPVSGITFTANEYAKYITQTGDINQAGAWFVKVIYTDPVQYLPSNYSGFAVGA